MIACKYLNSNQEVYAFRILGSKHQMMAPVYACSASVPVMQISCMNTALNSKPQSHTVHSA